MSEPLDMTVRELIGRLESLSEDDQRVLGRHLVNRAQRLFNIPGAAALDSMARLLDVLATRYRAQPAAVPAVNAERIAYAIGRLVRRKRSQNRRFPRRSFYPLIAALHCLRIGDILNLQLAMQRFADVIADPEGDSEEVDEARMILAAMQVVHDASPVKYHLDAVHANPDLQGSRCVLCLAHMPF